MDNEVCIRQILLKSVHVERLPVASDGGWCLGTGDVLELDDSRDH